MKARSLLFVPANQRNKVEKSRTFGADVVVLDLEDSVPSGPEKEHARHLVTEAARWEWQTPLLLRLNTEPQELDADVAFFGGKLPLPLCLAKAEPEVIGRYAGGQVRAAIIETALGVITCEEIAQFPGLELMLVGTGDLAADLGAHEDRDAAPFAYARSRVLMAAGARGLRALDAGSPEMRDTAGFRKMCEKARRLGFAGIICIHPLQVEVANEAFLSSKEEVRWAHQVLAAWEEANRQGLGVGIIGDRMIDEVHVRHARKILERT